MFHREIPNQNGDFNGKSSLEWGISTCWPHVCRKFQLVSQRYWLWGKPSNARGWPVRSRIYPATYGPYPTNRYINRYTNRYTNSAFRIRARLHGFPTGSQAPRHPSVPRCATAARKVWGWDSNATHRLVCNDLQCMLLKLPLKVFGELDFWVLIKP